MLDFKTKSIYKVGNKTAIVKVEWMVSGGSNLTLVQNGKPNTISSSYSNQAGDPKYSDSRTLFGVRDNGSVVIVDVDGSIDGKQSATLMKNLGCVDAILLDGNGSTQCMYNGKTVVTGDSRRLGSVICVEKK